jgi:hypothetical protein
VNSGLETATSGRQSAVRWLFAVSLVALAVRAILWISYQPVAYSDTNSYHRSALAILDEWKAYDGTRTPGYPIFLALLRADQDGWEQRTWLAQMGLGFLITLLLFYIGWQISGKAWLGGLAALAHTLNLGQLFFEANLLTETLTTFWVILTLAGAALWLYHPRVRTLWLALGLGTTSALAALTRPLFLYLPLLVLLLLVIFNAKSRGDEGAKNHKLFGVFVSWRLSVKYAISFLLPVLLIIGGWANFIHTNYHDWALTTMTGYHLMQHTGGFFEFVPDKYAALRDTYIRYRDAHIAKYGTQTNTIWDAIPEMEKASGFGFYDLSRRLAQISIQLIREHPDLYLRNVLEGWWMFWRAPVYWSPEAFRWPGLAGPLRLVIAVERAVLIAGNLAFVAASLWYMISSLVKRSNVERIIPNVFLIGTIWLCSIAQTLLDHGDNPRFLIPLQSLVVLWVVSWAVTWSDSRPLLVKL